MSEARKIPRDRIPGRTLCVLRPELQGYFALLNQKLSCAREISITEKTPSLTVKLTLFKSKSCGYNYKFLILFIKICHEKAGAHRQP